MYIYFWFGKLPFVGILFSIALKWRRCVYEIVCIDCTYPYNCSLCSVRALSNDWRERKRRIRSNDLLKKHNFGVEVVGKRRIYKSKSVCRIAVIQRCDNFEKMKNFISVTHSHITCLPRNLFPVSYFCLLFTIHETKKFSGNSVIISSNI